MMAQQVARRQKQPHEVGRVVADARASRRSALSASGSGSVSGKTTSVWAAKTAMPSSPSAGPGRLRMTFLASSMRTAETGAPWASSQSRTNSARRSSWPDGAGICASARRSSSSSSWHASA